MEQETILIIEDDEDIRKGIKLLLSSEGYNTLEAGTGMDGIMLLDDNVDLVILDVMMPGWSGIETCEKIRETSNVPVLFLTAKSTEKDKVLGLNVGGDDYLSKPFSYPELLSRVKALLRRYHIYLGKSLESKKVLKFSNITMNDETMEVFIDDKNIELTDLEYRMLHLMLEHPRKTFSAQEIYETIWNEPYLYSSNGTVMVHIRKLRMKIEHNPEEPEHIKTVWGKGYRFE